MNAYAKAKGIGSGWYLNSCDCCERGSLQPDWPPQMRGDANAIFELGFDGIKLDSCGPSQHLLEWVALLNETGKPILVENCFDNASFPFTTSGVDNGNEVVEEDACPMNMFRSGGDMRAQWPLMLRRLQTVVPWLRLSRPKCTLIRFILCVRTRVRARVHVRPRPRVRTCASASTCACACNCVPLPLPLPRRVRARACVPVRGRPKCKLIRFIIYECVRV